MENSGTANLGIYLYCVTDAHNRIPCLPGVDENFLTFPLQVGEIMAMVSEVRYDVFTNAVLKEKLNDLQWAESRIRNHDACIKAALDCGAVLPFKFATIFPSRPSIENWLAQNQKVLKAALVYFSDKEEWGVKAFCTRKILLAFLESRNESAKGMDQELALQSPGRAFFLKKQKAELLNSLTENSLSAYCKNIYSQLEGLAIKTVDLDLWARQNNQTSEEMIFNSSFLIEKSLAKNAQQRIEQCNEQFAMMGLHALCSGPWPPYNFVNEFFLSYGMNERP